MKQNWFWRFCIIATLFSLMAAFTQIHVIKTESDLNTMYNKLESRKGTLVIEISESVVIDTETGEGETVIGGYYIHHTENKYKNGKHMLSVFVYNPANNATDDILWRFDIPK